MKYLTIKQFATQMSRDLRKRMIPAEKIFWEKVRDRNIMAYKFHRQYPLYFVYNNQKRFFIADFYCHALQLVVEIDGGIHEQQQAYDKLHSEIIHKQKELHVIRFKNEEVLNNINSVLIELKKFITLPPSFPQEGRVSKGRDGSP